MIKVVIIGFGNVGSHLSQICAATEGIKVLQVYTRSVPNTTTTTPFLIHDLKDISTAADIYIAAVPDDKINDITAKLPFANKLVVHTSGGSDVASIHKKNRKGVFYPLQTFSKNKVVNFNNIPILVEAENKDDLGLLLELGHKISEKVQQINSKERAALHVAAVFVNNFVNELYHVSEDILKEQDLNFNLLLPLIKETALKMELLTPSLAQTGPAKRGDAKTIRKHQELLNKKQQSIYDLLTKSIQHRNQEDE